MYFYYTNKVNNPPVTTVDFLWGSLVGLIQILAQLSLTLAYAHGPGGPVNALASTQSLFQLALDIMVNH